MKQVASNLIMKIQVRAVLFAGLAAVFANASTTPRNMSVGSVLRDPGALMVLHTSMMRRLEVTGPPTPLPTSEMTPVTSEARLEGAIQAGESLVLLGADILLSKAIYILSGAPFTLDGSGYALDGAHNHTCVVVDAAANVTLRNITIVHGSSRFGGGVFVSGGSHLYVIHGRIIKNRATQSGGGYLPRSRLNSGLLTLWSSPTMPRQEVAYRLTVHAASSIPQ